MEELTSVALKDSILLTISLSYLVSILEQYHEVESLKVVNMEQGSNLELEEAFHSNLKAKLEEVGNSREEASYIVVVEGSSTTADNNQQEALGVEVSSRG